MNDIKQIMIFSAQDNIQAEMLLETLMNNQIPAYKTDVGSSGIMNIYAGNSMCGENIYVAEKDVQRAKQILQDIGLE